MICLFVIKKQKFVKFIASIGYSDVWCDEDLSIFLAEDFLHPSSDDYYLEDDPDLEFADPKSLVVDKADQDDYKKHFRKSNVS